MLDTRQQGDASLHCGLGVYTTFRVQASPSGHLVSGSQAWEAMSLVFTPPVVCTPTCEVGDIGATPPGRSPSPGPLEGGMRVLDGATSPSLAMCSWASAGQGHTCRVAACCLMECTLPLGCCRLRPHKMAPQPSAILSEAAAGGLGEEGGRPPPAPCLPRVAWTEPSTGPAPARPWPWLPWAWHQPTSWHNGLGTQPLTQP